MRPLTTVHRARAAMGTDFEALLLGDDAEHLAAVAEAVLDEITRVDRLLSRFDPRSELARINRCAAREPVQIDFEVAGILAQCRSAWSETEGAFDITAGSEPGVTFADVCFDEGRRQVRFARPGVRLDLGGFAKGYALDRAAEILDEHGVTRALVHGGTSSIVTRGFGPNDRAWPIALADPWDEAGAPVATVERTGGAISCSTVFREVADRQEPRPPVSDFASDLVDPATGRPIAEQAGCVVIAAGAAEAEILSTALLCLGRDRGRALIETTFRTRCRVGWIRPPSATPRVEWWGEWEA